MNSLGTEALAFRSTGTRLLTAVGDLRQAPAEAPRPPSSTHLELALEWPKDSSLLQHSGSCLETQEGGRTGHFLTGFWPLQVL